MEQRQMLETKREENLKIFCLTVTPSVGEFVTAEEKTNPTYRFDTGQFILAFNLEEVQNSIHERYKGKRVTVKLHGDILFADIAKNVYHEQFKKKETPETKKEDFLMNVKLIADRFLEYEDSQTLKTIINKIS